MTLKEQWDKLKENWLLVLLALILIGVVAMGGNFGSTLQSVSRGSFAEMATDEYYAPNAAYTKSMGGVSMPYYDGDFAPEVEDRKITKTASLSTEVERGEFRDEETKLKAIIVSSDSFLLNENAARYGEGWRGYYQGSYQIKVESKKYGSVISQIKEIGEVQSFSESSNDITGRYTDVNIELQAEKERLNRYKAMYSEATTVQEKIDLNDRIFNQERTIKYLEDSIARMDTRVDYSTISVTLTEEQSGYFDLQFVKLSELLKNIVRSTAGLLRLITLLLPYALAGLIVWIVVKRFRKRK